MNIRNKKVCVLTHARAGARLEKIPPVRLDAQRVSNRLLFTVPCTLLQGILPLAARRLFNGLDALQFASGCAVNCNSNRAKELMVTAHAYTNIWKCAMMSKALWPYG